MVFNELGDPQKKDNEMILINPKVTTSINNDNDTNTNTNTMQILDKSPGTDLKEEGCLSFPQIYGKVLLLLLVQL